MIDHSSRRSFLAGLTGTAAFGRAAIASRGQARPSAPLALPPFLARPTTDSIVLATRNGPVDATASLEVKRFGPDAWRAVGSAVPLGAGEFVTWEVDALAAATAYSYRILSGPRGGDPSIAATGRFTSQRVGEDSFTAALLTDAHTGSFAEGSRPLRVMDDVIRNVVADRPEFLLALGDNVAWATSRELPQEDPGGATFAYTMYRRHMAPLTIACPHFGLIGNWEGESGKVPREAAARMATVRHQFAPNPNDRTYPQGGNANQDYYAFDWGPALFVVLNVQSYSIPSGPLDSLLDDVAAVEDWTLGTEQFAWLERTLAGSDHPFRIVCVHHVVGGNAGNRFDTLYGRGGHRAARVGEQRRVHELMRDTGVQLFLFGHDHVFVDEVVDGIHYTIPGSCGAPWKFDRAVTGYARFWPDSGHGRLTVRPDRATVEFVNQAGLVIHEFSVEPRRGV